MKTEHRTARPNKIFAIGIIVVAIAYLAIAITIHPDSFYSGPILFDIFVLRQPQKALVALNKAISLNPKEPGYYNLRAALSTDIGQVQRAVDDYTTYISFHPKDVDHAYTCRAACFLKLGEYNKAIDDYSSAIAISPQKEGFYGLRAEAYNQMGQCSKALADSNSAITLRPKAGWAYWIRASVFDKLAKHDLAQADRRKAQELGYKQ